MSNSEDRSIAQILTFAGREFDRVRGIVVDEDEPGETEVAAETPKPAEPEKDRSALGTAFAVASTAARLAQRAVTGSVHPAHRDWSKASLDDRIDWWVQRFGTAAAAVAAVPGLGGRIGKVTGVGAVVGAAAQVLVVNAVAREMGVEDLQQRVAAAGRIVLGRDLDESELAPAMEDDESRPEKVDLPEEERNGLLDRLGTTGTLVWRVATQVVRVRTSLGKRPQGGTVTQLLSNLPVVGAPAAFVSERSGISQAAKQARETFSTP